MMKDVKKKKLTKKEKRLKKKLEMKNYGCGSYSEWKKREGMIHDDPLEFIR